MNIIPIPESMTKKSGRIKMKKRVLVALLATALTVSMMTGCGSKKTEDTSSTKTEETSEDSDQEAADKVAKLIDDIYVQERTDKTDEQCKAAKEAWDKLTDAQKELVEGENADPDYFGRDTGDASKDDPLNEDNIGENEILVVSFGTSFNDSRAEDIGGVEKALQAAYPDWSVRRAFTAQIIINHVEARDDEVIDNMQQALDRAVENGVKNLVVQPTHLMHGAEYDEMTEAINGYKDKFESVAIAEPMLGTPFYHIVWDKKGRMTSIFDKENDREILKAGELGNHLVVYEDRPMKYDAWDIDIYYQEKGYEVDDLKTVSVEKSSLMTKVKMDWNYQDSTISQEIRFYNDNRRIDFVTHADWHEHQQLLRVLFPLDIRTSEATFDIQYGNVKRPTYENTSWDMAKFETVAHQWADYSETGYGVSLMNDCKYGYSAKGYVLGMSLIKCGIHPDYAADQGIHDFTYALYPHSGSWQESGVQKEAWRLNNPLWTVEGAVDAEVQSAFCKADTDHVAIDCIKKAEDSEDLIIRFHEYAGMRGPVTLNFGFPVDSWQETDLMENPDGEEMTGELKVTVRPYEIRTFRVTPKK